MLDVLFKRFGIDEYVVEICDAVFIEELVEDRVDECLERGGCIRETEWHDAVLEMFVSSSESRLPFFSKGYSYLIESR